MGGSAEFVDWAGFLNGTQFQQLPRRAKASQYNKMHLMDTALKGWDRVLYLDCGMQIQHSLHHLMAVDTMGRFVANYDGFDIAHQFTSLTDISLYQQLGMEYNLNQQAFQSTLLMFETSLIHENS